MWIDRRPTALTKSLIRASYFVYGDQDVVGDLPNGSLQGLEKQSSVLKCIKARAFPMFRLVYLVSMPRSLYHIEEAVFSHPSILFPEHLVN